MIGPEILVPEGHYNMTLSWWQEFLERFPFPEQLAGEDRRNSCGSQPRCEWHKGWQNCELQNPPGSGGCSASGWSICFQARKLEFRSSWQPAFNSSLTWEGSNGIPRTSWLAKQTSQMDELWVELRDPFSMNKEEDWGRLLASTLSPHMHTHTGAPIQEVVDLKGLGEDWGEYDPITLYSCMQSSNN